jgi:hypothetical protein
MAGLEGRIKKSKAFDFVAGWAYYYSKYCFPAWPMGISSVVANVRKPE